jgi:hypothetical protein
VPLQTRGERDIDVQGQGIIVKQRSLFFCLFISGFVFLLSGCFATYPPDSSVRRFFDKLNEYPGTRKQLMIPHLTETSADSIPNLPGSNDVFVMVHPAYSLFFRDPNRGRFGESTYSLLATQFDKEAQFIASASRAGKIILLVVPGNYDAESTAPLSYTAYLNAVAAQRRSVFYIFSETHSTGSLSMNDMLSLYRFLYRVKVRKVLIGGGYIGRCQREFYSQLTAYFDKTAAYIVPEISSISPDDVNEGEAGVIVHSMAQQDYSAVRQFIQKKLEAEVNIFFLSQDELSQPR